MKQNNMGARWRPTFRAWLYQHRQAHGVIGNVARAVIVDRCLTGEDAHTVTAYQRHWQQIHGATADDLRALAVAWEHYQREVHQHAS